MPKAKYPLQVELNQRTALKLVKVFKRAHIDIVNELKSATDFGAYNRRVILAQIEAHLAQLGVDVEQFLRDELPEYYKKGADDAVRQLKRVDAELAVEHGFNIIHQDAIVALIDDTAKSFGDSLSTVSRSVGKLFSKATREMLTYQLAEGTISGKSLRAIRKTIVSTLEMEGLPALVDKAGRKWSLDRYAEMLIRTKSVESRNRGMINRVVENGYDLVQVSDHVGECPLCRPWEGEILSLTGADKRYPTLAQAEADGLFHPNCRHAINTLVPELAAVTKAYSTGTGKYISPKTARKVSGAETQKKT